MICITDEASARRALSDTNLDPELRDLLARRVLELGVGLDRPVGSGPRTFAVEGGDTAEAINSALNFPITRPDAEEPSYDWIEDHGLWFEVAYTREEGAHVRVFVENGPATELGLHCLCLNHFWTDGEGEAS